MSTPTPRDYLRAAIDEKRAAEQRAMEAERARTRAEERLRGARERQRTWHNTQRQRRSALLANLHCLEHGDELETDPQSVDAIAERSLSLEVERIEALLDDLGREIAHAKTEALAADQQCRKWAAEILAGEAAALARQCVALEDARVAL